MFELQLTPAIYGVDNSDTAKPVSDSPYRGRGLAL
jgi:hypothetical protein